MSIKSWYIPKSKKASEAAKILDLPRKAIAGKYVSNVLAGDETPEQLSDLAWALDPEAAAHMREQAHQTADLMRQKPQEYGPDAKEVLKAAQKLFDYWPLLTP